MLNGMYDLEWFMDHPCGEWESPYLSEFMVAMFKITIWMAIGVFIITRYMISTIVRTFLVRR